MPRSLVLCAVFVSLFFAALFTSACQQKPVKPKDEFPQIDFILEPRQITFDGLRSGEGYFSADGRLMVFQAERENGNPFYQIYLKDLETGRTTRVSNGEGKTTCAWIHPSNSKVMYSSTHKDPKWREKAKLQYEVRQKGEREKYAWSYDDNFDIYEKNLKSGIFKAINPARGYDAEGSYSPDGAWIAFASNRHAYSQKLSPEDAKRLEDDPSYFLDIYLMRADGTGLKRLTEVAGYDGGPFFSPDGKSIVWRRFTADGRMADVWTMNIDGGEQKQITNMQAMSWAPFFHPSGDYIIFTTNKLGYDNFELYMIDTQGKHEPVRVTSRPGFDGLPVFSPDGKKIAWTQRNEKNESQIYMGNWDDALARKSLGLESRIAAPGFGTPEIHQSDVRQWVEYLASAEMKGRHAGSVEEKIYTKAIADQFARLGLSKIVPEGFSQSFRYQSGVKLGARNHLFFTAEGLKDLKVDQDWAPLSLSSSGEFPSAEVAIAGYGIVAPVSEKMAAYDSYSGLDVKGRWAMVLKDLPEGLTNEQRFHLHVYASLHHKVLVARQAGAIGLIYVVPGAKTAKLHYQGVGSGLASIPVLQVSHDVAEKLLKTSGQGVAGWQKDLSNGQIKNAVLKDLKLAAQISVEPDYSQAINVIAELKVPGATTTVMIGAHGDHLGMGEHGNSLAKDQEKGQVHLGADDNASGVAAVMELAQYFSQQVRSGALKPKTNFAFAIWSAEELGILGSTHFINQYHSAIKVYLNLDMVGRLTGKLMVQGTGSSEQWSKILEPIGLRSGVALSLQQDPYLPTDSLAFYLKKIPSLSFFTGAHAEYHSPRDHADLINYPGLVNVTKVVGDIAQSIAVANPEVSYKKVEGRPATSGGRNFRLYLGTIPDYTQEGIKGVKLSGTTKASPAEKAGLLQGDVIVQLGGVKIDNIQDYVYCLQSMKANQKTPVKVMREGKLIDLEIVPAAKGI